MALIEMGLTKIVIQLKVHLAIYLASVLNGFNTDDVKSFFALFTFFVYRHALGSIAHIKIAIVSNYLNLLNPNTKYMRVPCGNMTGCSLPRSHDDLFIAAMKSKQKL